MMGEHRAAKTVLISGSNRGIGLELARQLGHRHWHVLATSREAPKPDSELGQLISHHSNVHWYQLDVCQTESIAQLASHLDLEGTSLDVLFNNAGILLDWNDSILNVDLEILQKTLSTNTIGPIRLTRALLPALQRSTTPLVVNVSSAAGSLTEMRDWAPAYSISKTALNAVTRQFSLALERLNIPVCCISPGWVQTDMGGPNATRSVGDAALGILELLDKPYPTLNGRFIRDSEELPW